MPPFQRRERPKKQPNISKESSSSGSEANTEDDSDTDVPTKSQKQKRISLTSRAGLVFPVGRLNRHLKSRQRERLGKKSGIFLAAVLEYLSAEILQAAQEATHADGKVYIKPIHLNKAIRDDEELSTLLGDVHLLGGGIFIPSYEPISRGNSGKAQKKKTTRGTTPKK
jgi:histone H2A